MLMFGEKRRAKSQALRVIQLWFSPEMSPAVSHLVLQKRDVTRMFAEVKLRWNRGTGVVHITGQGSGVGKGRRAGMFPKFDLVTRTRE